MHQSGQQAHSNLQQLKCHPVTLANQTADSKKQQEHSYPSNLGEEACEMTKCSNTCTHHKDDHSFKIRE